MSERGLGSARIVAIGLSIDDFVAMLYTPVIKRSWSHGRAGQLPTASFSLTVTARWRQRSSRQRNAANEIVFLYYVV